jgi:hypothetical protein
MHKPVGIKRVRYNRVIEIIHQPFCCCHLSYLGVHLFRLREANAFMFRQELMNIF